MKFMTAVLVSGFLSAAAWAGPVQLPSGNYTCSNSSDEVVAAFYIREDGTSKKVEILAAEREREASHSACFHVDFKWLSSAKRVDDVFCCPWYPY